MRKVHSTSGKVKSCTDLLETARTAHRAAILAAVEGGIAGRKLARDLGISEPVLREKLARARVEREQSSSNGSR